jgi:hypothetical protein
MHGWSRKWKDLDWNRENPDFMVVLLSVSLPTSSPIPRMERATIAALADFLRL